VEAHDIDVMREELSRLLVMRSIVMERNGIVARTAGTGHHLLERTSPLLDWLSGIAQSPVVALLRQALGGNVILNSFGAVDNRKGRDQYVGNVHRDVRTYTSDKRLMVQLLLTLDDFRPDTGATWILPGSHRAEQKPDDQTFFANARQIYAPAGRLLFFDSRVWHAAGVNRTDSPRRALTLTFTRPFIKPQFDYCRYLGFEYVEGQPEALQQMLGYFARVPATPDEWYQPPERRFYRSTQG
jgi:ectoine hydroxylase-related dioxygenase (phytanoyl-CoA dioxygenase family)